MKLFTNRVSLYHQIFFGLFRYDRGLKDFFLKANYPTSKMKILDAGCGSGVVTKSLIGLAKRKKCSSIRYYGFDITPAMLALFHNWNDKTKAGVSIRQADVLQLETLPDTWHDFDLIVSSGMLEYIPKTKIIYALRNLKKRLSQNGTILLFISKKNLINKLLIERWWKAYTYERDEIYQKLQDAEFINIEFKQFHTPYSYLNAWGFVISAKKF